MDRKVCYVCGKENLSKTEVGLTRKLLNRGVKCYYCLDCLAEYLEVDPDDLLVRAEDFKTQGCTLFG